MNSGRNSQYLLDQILNSYNGRNCIQYFRSLPCLLVPRLVTAVLVMHHWQTIFRSGSSKCKSPFFVARRSTQCSHCGFPLVFIAVDRRTGIVWSLKRDIQEIELFSMQSRYRYVPLFPFEEIRIIRFSHITTVTTNCNRERSVSNLQILSPISCQPIPLMYYTCVISRPTNPLEAKR